MSRTPELQIVQYRPRMLYARRLVRQYSPIALLLGFVCWEVAVFLFCGGAGLALVAACVLACLGCFSVVPLMMMFGAWLSVDQTRGWVHYRQCGCRGRSQESFSPQRIDSLQVRQRGFLGRLFRWWRLDLRLDHPRLANVCLMRSRDRKRIDRMAGDLSCLMGVGWYDEKGNLYRDEPLATDTPVHSLNTHHNVLPPPPEIEIHTRQGRMTLVLPHSGTLTQSMVMFLLYALVWCLWSWTSLTLEWLDLEAMAQVHARQYSILALLFLASLTGGGLLIRVLYEILAHEELLATAKGWILIRRWLGLPLGPHPLSPMGIKGQRRIEPPNRHAGLWIGDGTGETHLGTGLSVEALYWLQAMLRNDPQALQARRSAMAEASLSAGPECDPDILIQPNALTGG